MIKNYIIFLLLIIIPFTVDVIKNKHNNIKHPLATFILLLHHTTSAYLYFGSLALKGYGFHFIFTIIILAVWIKSKFKCYITEYYNKLINNDKDSPLEDIAFYIKKIIPFKYINIVFLLAILVYDIRGLSNVLVSKHV